MFFFDVIFKIDSSIIVGIIVVQYISRDGSDVFTSPSSFTFGNSEWTVTIDMFISFWTIFVSPVVFNHDNA